MTITSDSKWNTLVEENELAFFRADVCLSSPQSFNLAEKRAICEGIDASAAAIDEAMRSDFQSWPPHAQARMLDLLQQADSEHFDRWIEMLVGEMPEKKQTTQSLRSK